MDVNDDGHADILSGSYSRHDPDMAGLFQVLRGRADGSFEPAVALTGTDGEPLIIAHAGRAEITEAICTRPFAVDWTGDGHLDLVVGNFRGGFHLFRGEGNGEFAPESEPILSDGRGLVVPGHHGDPFCIDWDGDGDLDLLSGSSQGGVYWARNDAANGAPELRGFEVLIPAGERREWGAFLAEDEISGPTGDTRIWVADVDLDGKLDILVGDNVTLVSPAKGLTEAASRAKEAEWDREFQALQDKMQQLAESGDTAEQEKVREQYSAHYERRSEFLNEERTGFVWLYLQK